MQLDIILRGQSNAAYLAELEGGAAARTLVQEVQQLLGFDGVSDSVRLVYDRDGKGGDTAYPGTAFLNEWMEPNGQGGWRAGEYEQGFLDRMAEYRAGGMGTASAVVWLHSEYDSRDPNLSTADWISAVRTDAALVRQTLGRDVPYLFVSAHPYGDGTDTGHQAIRAGMEGLAADPGFNAAIAARAPDIDGSLDNLDGNPSTAEFGGAHINPYDAKLIAARLARSVAEEFAAYAKPGSAVASSGGNIASEGPEVVAARAAGRNALQVDVVHDGAAGFLPLNEGAADGLGWSARLADGRRVEATGARILDADSLVVTFGEAVPTGAVLDYAWGIGRIAEPGGPGLGNAVMDETYLSVWTPAGGVAVGGGAPAAPAVLQPPPAAQPAPPVAEPAQPAAPPVAEPAPPAAPPAAQPAAPPPPVAEAPAAPPVVVAPPAPPAPVAEAPASPPPAAAPEPAPGLDPELVTAAALVRLSFGRAGSEGEVLGLQSMLESGVSANDVARALADSDPFQDRTSGLEDEAYIARLHQDALGRDPTGAEVAEWQGYFGAGAPRELLAEELANWWEFAAVAEARAPQDITWA